MDEYDGMLEGDISDRDFKEGYVASNDEDFFESDNIYAIDRPLQYYGPRSVAPKKNPPPRPAYGKPEPRPVPMPAYSEIWDLRSPCFCVPRALTMNAETGLLRNVPLAEWQAEQEAFRDSQTPEHRRFFAGEQDHGEITGSFDRWSNTLTPLQRQMAREAAITGRGDVLFSLGGEHDPRPWHLRPEQILRWPGVAPADVRGIIADLSAMNATPGIADYFRNPEHRSELATLAAEMRQFALPESDALSRAERFYDDSPPMSQDMEGELDADGVRQYERDSETKTDETETDETETGETIAADAPGSARFFRADNPADDAPAWRTRQTPATETALKAAGAGKYPAGHFPDDIRDVLCLLASRHERRVDAAIFGEPSALVQAQARLIASGTRPDARPWVRVVMDMEPLPPGADRNALEKALQRGSVFDAVRTARTASKLAESMASAKRLKATRSEERGLWDSFRIAERRIYVQTHGEPTPRSLKWAERLATKGADLKKAAIAIAALPPKERAFLSPLLSRAQYRARKAAPVKAAAPAPVKAAAPVKKPRPTKDDRLAIIRDARLVVLKAAEENPADQKAVKKAAIWEDLWEKILDAQEHTFRAPYDMDDAIVGQDPDGHARAVETLELYERLEWEHIKQFEKLL